MKYASRRKKKIVSVIFALLAGRRALFRYVYFPACLPAMLTALRISTATAIAVLFIAEQSLTTYGLGYYIVVETYQVLKYPQMYAGIQPIAGSHGPAGAYLQPAFVGRIGPVNALTLLH